MLTECCVSSSWVKKMIESPIVEYLVDQEEIAEENWYSVSLFVNGVFFNREQVD